MRGHCPLWFCLQNDHDEICFCFLCHTHDFSFTRRDKEFGLFTLNLVCVHPAFHSWGETHEKKTFWKRIPNQNSIQSHLKIFLSSSQPRFHFENGWKKSYVVLRFDMHCPIITMRRDHFFFWICVQNSQNDNIYLFFCIKATSFFIYEERRRNERVRSSTLHHEFLCSPVSPTTTTYATFIRFRSDMCTLFPSHLLAYMSEQMRKKLAGEVTFHQSHLMVASSSRDPLVWWVLCVCCSFLIRLCISFLVAGEHLLFLWGGDHPFSYTLPLNDLPHPRTSSAIFFAKPWTKRESHTFEVTSNPVCILDYFSGCSCKCASFPSTCTWVRWSEWSIPCCISAGWGCFDHVIEVLPAVPKSGVLRCGHSPHTCKC